MTVIKINDEAIRTEIENWSIENSFPDLIQFVACADGSWCVGTEVMENEKFEGIRNLLQQYGVEEEFI